MIFVVNILMIENILDDDCINVLLRENEEYNNQTYITNDVIH